MTPVCVAIYARVSSEQQATSNTIDSQIAALEARLTQDGLCLTPEGRFTDKGYSGATLVRPALERLRDAVAAGNLDRLYVHSPDRLARRYAYQVLLIDEFHRAGWTSTSRATACRGAVGRIGRFHFRRPKLPRPSDGQRGRSRGRTGDRRRAITFDSHGHGIAFGSRGPWRRSGRRVRGRESRPHGEGPQVP